jgi:hypothetical protein
MFAFFSVVVVCATVVFLAIKQPTFKFEIMHKQEPIYDTTSKPIEGFKIDDTKEVDELADMLGDIKELFTGGDRVDD